MRARSGFLYSGGLAPGPYASALIASKFEPPVILDDRFDYANGQLELVAPAVWSRNGGVALSVLDGIVTSGAALSSSAPYSPLISLDGSKRRSVTIYDLDTGEPVVDSNTFTITLDATIQHGSGGMHVLCSGSSTNSTLALNTSSGSTVVGIGAPFGSRIAWGEIKLLAEADGTAKLYRNGALIATRAGAVRTAAYRYAPITWASGGVSNTNVPNVRFSRALFRGTAVV